MTRVHSFEDIKSNFTEVTGLDVPLDQHRFASCVLFGDSPLFKQVSPEVSDEKLFSLFSEFTFQFGVPETILDVEKDFAVFSVSLKELKKHHSAIFRLEPKMVFQTDNKNDVLEYANGRDEIKPFLLYDREVKRLLYVVK